MRTQGDRNTIYKEDRMRKTRDIDLTNEEIKLISSALRQYISPTEEVDHHAQLTIRFLNLENEMIEED